MHNRPMITRLTLLRHAPTSTTRLAAFSDDEPLDQAAKQSLRGLQTGRWDRAWTSPALRAMETAAELGLEATVAPALDDADPGSWKGRRLADIAHLEPQALADWLRDPAVPPPGGESAVEVHARVSSWLAEQAADGGRVIAVTHAIVIRAAVALAMLAPPEAIWRVDVAPLSRTILHARDGRWIVRAVNLLHL
jgi:broad specificity phosphatase PhoE